MNKILLLYQEVLALEQRLKNKHILYRQYEELERELVHLEYSIDSTQKDPTNPIQKKHEETDSISSIKKKLSTLNQKIDLYEDLEEDFLKNSKDRLVNELLLLFPDEKEIYTKLENTYKKYEGLYDKLTLVIPLFKELLHMLGLAIQSRNKLKKRGLLSFLFGRNPNADVIDFLREAEESKKQLLASLETHRSLSLISPPFQNNSIKCKPSLVNLM